MNEVAVSKCNALRHAARAQQSASITGRRWTRAKCVRLHLSGQAPRSVADKREVSHLLEMSGQLHARAGHGSKCSMLNRHPKASSEKWFFNIFYQIYT
jgi:hypothetical protein